MTVVDALAAVGGLGVLTFGLIVAHKATGPTCDHEMRTQTHEPTGRKFRSCRCGLFFRRVT